MKKILIAIFICFLVVLASCTGSYIYAAIETEVKLKDSSVSGTVSNIVSVGDVLYLAHGEIKTKKAFTEGKWVKLEPPKGCEKAFCTSVASDGSNLYAVFHLEDKSKPSLFVYNGSWTPVSKSEGIDYVVGNGSVLATKTETITNGITTTTNKLEIFTVTPTQVTSLKLFDTEGSINHITAVGGGYFATSEGLFDKTGALIPNSPKDIKAITPEGGYILTSDTLYKGTDFSTGYKHGIKEPSGASILTIDGSERLLVSSNATTAGGYYDIYLNSNLSASETVKPGSKEGSSTSPKCVDQYNSAIGKHPCSNIFAQSNGKDYFIYLNIHDTYNKYDGLWSYYSAGKLEWNRE